MKSRPARDVPGRQAGAGPAPFKVIIEVAGDLWPGEGTARGHGEDVRCAGARNFLRHDRGRLGADDARGGHRHGRLRLVRTAGAVSPLQDRHGWQGRGSGFVRPAVGRGPRHVSGYYADPQATAAAFEGEWFKTGDLFRRDEDGYYYMLGRIKDVIRRSGENISAAEIEFTVNAIDGVLEAAAVPVPDALRGEEVKIVVARAPGASGAQLSAQDMMESLPGGAVAVQGAALRAVPRFPAQDSQSKTNRNQATEPPLALSQAHEQTSSQTAIYAPLHAAHQRQGRALYPNRPARMGLCALLPELGRTRRTT